ncbi:MAG: cytochrome c3 family protein [Syntrophorhabdaceae bacterium]
MPAESQYKAYLVDPKIVDTDPHFTDGCASCHRGDEKAASREKAHAGIVKKPSSDLKICAQCHEKITGVYKSALHFTTEGFRSGVSGRFSAAEKKVFNDKVFERSCRSCHASCGDCHVASPKIGGITTGLLKGHQFVAKNDTKTCSTCHGGRVYPEFTGDFGGQADVHYQRGMTCLSCHNKAEMHGTGQKYMSKTDVKEKPACINCHKAGSEKTTKAKTSHAQHKGKVSCYACHSGGSYTNCYNCHPGKGAIPKPGFYLGLDPKDKKTVTTLRLVPTVRDTFKSAGIAMQNFDLVPNYWGSAVHNIKKRTDRTRSCDVCHVEKKHFLTKDMLIKDGSKANNLLIYSPKSTKN